MTAHRRRPTCEKARTALRSATLLALAALAGGCSISGATPAEPLRFRSDQSKIEVVSTQVGGKNVFVPSTIVVTPVARTLSIYNTTDIPHGFAIPGLGIELVLPPQQETPVSLPNLEGGRVHRIGCHLHPPHRSATLVVLPD